MLRALALTLLLSLLPGALEVTEQIGHLLSTGGFAHSASDEDAHHHDHEQTSDRDVWASAHQGHHQEAAESHCSAVAHVCHCCPPASIAIGVRIEIVTTVSVRSELPVSAMKLHAGIAPRLMRPPIV